MAVILFTDGAIVSGFALSLAVYTYLDTFLARCTG